MHQVQKHKHNFRGKPEQHTLAEEQDYKSKEKHMVRVIAKDSTLLGKLEVAMHHASDIL